MTRDQCLAAVKYILTTYDIDKLFYADAIDGILNLDDRSSRQAGEERD